MDIQTLTLIGIICGIIFGVIQAFPTIVRGIQLSYRHLIYKNFFAPRITYGIYDHPTALSTHFYLIVKNVDEIDIQLILKPKMLQPYDYNVTVMHFYTTIGYESLQTVKTSHTDHEDFKEVNMRLQKNQEYRIIIEGQGGPVESLLYHNYKITIKARDTKIIEKPNKSIFSIH